MRLGTESPSPVDDRRFFAGMTLAAAAVVFFGFAASYYLWPVLRATHYPNGRPVSPALPFVVHVHAVTFTAWVLLLLVQTGLVLQGLVGRHRTLGALAAWLIPLMVLTGVLTAMRGARDGWNPGGPYRDALGFMFVGLADVAVFTSLTAAGLIWRRNPGLHKRLMLLGTLGGLMWPAITRMPILGGRFGLMFALLGALVLAPAIRDFYRRAPLRWVSLALGVGILASFLVRPVVGNTAWWRACAAWLIA
jgi:hypothetical protein